MLQVRCNFRLLAEQFHVWCSFMNAKKALWQKAVLHWELRSFVICRYRILRIFSRWQKFMEHRRKKIKQARLSILFYYEKNLQKHLKHWKMHVSIRRIFHSKTRLALIHRYHHTITSHFYFWRYWACCRRTKRYMNSNSRVQFTTGKNNVGGSGYANLENGLVGEESASLSFFLGNVAQKLRRIESSPSVVLSHLNLSISGRSQKKTSIPEIRNEHA